MCIVLTIEPKRDLSLSAVQKRDSTGWYSHDTEDNPERLNQQVTVISKRTEDIDCEQAYSHTSFRNSKRNLAGNGSYYRRSLLGVGSPMITFGPVPSRRLGRSIGINNIPAKNCTYSCPYCQLGRTREQTIERQTFYDPELILADAEYRVERTASEGERIDYLTFVPDGEPTLDINLQREVELLGRLDLPIAILTNSSLVWRNDVRSALYDMDRVSLKVDAVSEKIWKRADRPHRQLSLKKILNGIVELSDQHEGTIITETMFVDGVDYRDEIDKIAEFLSGLNIDKAYIAVPTRPPAEDWVRPASEGILNQAFCSFSEKLGQDRVELLIGYEGNAFSSTGSFEEDLLSITSVHPMRKDAVEKLADKAEASWERVELLLEDGGLIELRYEGETYFMRRLPSR